MSTNYNAVVIYGIMVSDGDMRPSKPNPEYNPNAPFSPKTGLRVPDRIFSHIDPEVLCKAHGLEYLEAHDRTYFGMFPTSTIDINYDTQVERFVPYDSDYQLRIARCTEALTNQLGIAARSPAFYLITYVN